MVLVCKASEDGLVGRKGSGGRKIQLTKNRYQWCIAIYCQVQCYKAGRHSCESHSCGRCSAVSLVDLVGCKVASYFNSGKYRQLTKIDVL